MLETEHWIEVELQMWIQAFSLGHSELNVELNFD